jgi:two-component system sensor histidine kinase KdpD
VPITTPRRTPRAAIEQEIAHTPLSRLLRYGTTLGVLALVTAVLWPVRETIGLLNIGLIYLMVVVGATVFGGRGAGICASVLGFALFDFFLVPPYLTFVISDLRNILALVVFLGVSALLSWLIAGARDQARQARQRAEDVSRLYELSQVIIGAQRRDEVLPAIAEKVRGVFAVEVCWILLPGPQQHLRVAVQAPARARLPTRDEMTLADWAFWHTLPVGQGGLTAPLRDGAGTRSSAAFVPLQAAGRTIGVLGVADKPDRRPFTAAEQTILATFADQVAVALDRVTLLREAERAELLARTDELKSALMSAVSHDLRTPLASIIASVTSLLEPGMTWDEATRRDFLQGIYEEAQRLNRLVGNLLDMSRIEGGALHPQKEWYSIAEVIGGVVQRLEPRLGTRPLMVEIEPNLPLVPLDYTEIDQVLTNLLENALKYTPPEAALRITARREDGTIAVSVADNGPGVPTEHLARLFDKFYRVEGRTRPQGLGLGLAISKGLIEAHGGRIWAANRLEGGLQITFTLPIPPPRPALTGAHAAPVAGR